MTVSPASGTGTMVGNLFQSGNVYLSNSQGSIQLSLSAIQVKVRKTMRREVATMVVAASGKYAPFVSDYGIDHDVARFEQAQRTRGVLPERSTASSQPPPALMVGRRALSDLVGALGSVGRRSGANPAPRLALN